MGKSSRSNTGMGLSVVQEHDFGWVGVDRALGGYNHLLVIDTKGRIRLGV